MSHTHVLTSTYRNTISPLLLMLGPLDTSLALTLSLLILPLFLSPAFPMVV